MPLIVVSRFLSLALLLRCTSRNEQRVTSHSLATRNDPRLQRLAMVGDVRRPAFPDAVHELAREAVLERLAQWAQPKRLAEHEGMDRDVADQRMLLALLDHLLELVHQHVAELAPRVLAVDDLG